MARAAPSIPDITPMGHPTTEVLCYNLRPTGAQFLLRNGKAKDIAQ